MGHKMAKLHYPDSMTAVGTRTSRMSSRISVNLKRSMTCDGFRMYGRKYSSTSSIPDFSEECPKKPSIVEIVDSCGLTERQKSLIRATFGMLRAVVEETGVIFFMRLFEKHPEVQDVFLPFRGISREDLRANKELRAHGMRVMGFLEKCVARLDHPEKISTICLELGLSHRRYGVPVTFLELVPPQFIFAVQPVLGEYWTPEVEAAWKTLFGLATELMKQTMELDGLKIVSRKSSI